MRAVHEGFELIPLENTTNRRFTASNVGGNSSLFHSTFGKSEIFRDLDVRKVPIH